MAPTKKEMKVAPKSEPVATRRFPLIAVCNGGKNPAKTPKIIQVIFLSFFSSSMDVVKSLFFFV
ncbi:hypothetical protein D3C78_1755970 [compost metagenome]